MADQRAAPSAATANPDFWRELIAQGDYWFRVISDSMAPTLLVGDEVLVRPLDFPSGPGEVIVFLQDGKLVVHRCIGDCRFRGDAKIIPDPPIPAGAIVGQAVAFRRNGRERKLGTSLPWVTRWARLKLRCGRLDRWLRRRLRHVLPGK
jgi:signal peptidase I